MGLIRKNILLLIILIASFLRLFLLGTNPISLNWDEVSMGYTAYSIGETGRDEWGEFMPIFFRSYGEWKSATYIYLLVPFVKVLGLEPYVVRLPSALSGILAVYLIYLIGQRISGKRVGLIAAFILAVTPWHLALSRPAFEANVSLTLMLLGIYGFIRAWQNNWEFKGLLISLLGFGLAPHTYNSAKIIIPFIIIYLTIRTGFWKARKFLIFYYLALAVFAIPILTNIFITGKAQYRYTQVGVTTDEKSLNEFYENRKTFPLGELGNKIVFNQVTFAVYKIADNWASYLSPSFLFVEAGDHRQHHVPYRGVLYLSYIGFIIFGLRSLRNYKLWELPLVVIGLGFLPGALTRDSEHVLRTILAIPGFILLISYGIDSLLRSSSFKLLKVLVAIFMVELITYLFMYFAWYPKATASDWQYGHQEVAAYLRENEANYDQIVMTKWYGEPQLFIAFYNRWDPVWYQSESQKLLDYEAKGHTWLDQLPEYSFGKYHFRYLNWQSEARTSDTLYISKWDDFYTDSSYKKTINYPNGQVVFHIVEGEKLYEK